MEVQEIMTARVITVGQDEPVTAAARLLCCGDGISALCP